MNKLPPEYAHVFSRLECVRPLAKPGRFKARCPSHDDKHPSLSVSVSGDGRRLLMRCNANRGCTFPSIVTALGLEPKDLFADYQTWRPGTVSAPKPEIEEVYQYRGVDGTVLYESVRYKPKDFRQRRPDPDNPGKYIWSMEGVQKVLYRLPDLIKALAKLPNRRLFILEGERKTDAFCNLGIPATTNVAGAGKWLPEYTEFFRGRNVAVLEDHDRVDKATGVRPGHKHAVGVCNALYGVAASVKLVHLPGLAEGEDPRDWLLKHPLETATDKKAVFDKIGKILADTPEWVPTPETPAESDPPFLRGAAATYRAARGAGVDLSNPDLVLGKLAKCHARLQNLLVFEPNNKAAVAKELMTLAAVARAAAEDMGCLAEPDAKPAAARA